jgi:hypothetical protein
VSWRAVIEVDCARLAFLPVSSVRVKDKSETHRDVLTAIADGMVALLKEFYGPGPTRTQSYYEDDLEVRVLPGRFSRMEETPLDCGRGAAVINQRIEPRRHA